jgi:glycosyltransferase involved in cell wall biosynthesis
VRSNPLPRRRIAFLTDEFPSESPDAGGLASYLDRTTRALCDLGHEVEVLTRTFGEPRVIDWDGVRVESVRPLDVGEAGWRRHRARWKWRALPVEVRRRLQASLALGRAFERRHGERGFDLVQSSNCSLSGLFVHRHPGLRHVLRMSSERLLWLRADGQRPRLADRIVARLERLQARRADAVYAPSRFLAEHLRRCWGREVSVIRPPAPQEPKPGVELPARLPERYLLHFGALRRRKGTELLAAALLRAWREEPRLQVVLAGRETPPGLLAPWRERWGPQRRNVRQLGALERREMLPVVARAAACVLPSLADNLPNTAIESLALGVPVIGSEGASFDELIQPGRNGELVARGDADALARALVRAWRGDAPWSGARFEKRACLTSMAPGPAAGALVRYALGSPPA